MVHIRKHSHPVCSDFPRARFPHFSAVARACMLLFARMAVVGMLYPCLSAQASVPVPDVTTLPTITGECSVTILTAPTATADNSITGTVRYPNYTRCPGADVRLVTTDAGGNQVSVFTTTTDASGLYTFCWDTLGSTGQNTSYIVAHKAGYVSARIEKVFGLSGPSSGNDITLVAPDAVIEAKKAAAPPNLDGNVNLATEWAGAHEIDFTKSDLNWMPSVATKGYAMWDDSDLYLAFVCQEPYPAGIVPNITAHDGAMWGPSGDDCIEMRIDESNGAGVGSGHEWWQLFMNTRGVTTDIEWRNAAQFEWNIGADVAGLTTWNQIGLGQWSQEVKIPFAGLRTTTGAGGAVPTESTEWYITLVRERHQPYEGMSVSSAILHFVTEATPPLVVEGTVRYPNGTPCPGADVRFVKTDAIDSQIAYATTATDDTGHYSFGPPAQDVANRYASYVVAHKAGYVSSYIQKQFGTLGLSSGNDITLTAPDTVIDARRAANPPNLDGNVDLATEWAGAQEISFTKSSTNPTPSVATKGYAMWDDINLYLAFVCQEPYPAGIVANITAHDGAMWGSDPYWNGDDLIALHIDASNGAGVGTGYEYWQLLLNTVGATTDVEWRDRASFEWNIGADVAGLTTWNQIGLGQWSQEVKIPFAGLMTSTGAGGVAPAGATEWYMTLGRQRHQPDPLGEHLSVSSAILRFVTDTSLLKSASTFASGTLDGSALAPTYAAPSSDDGCSRTIVGTTTDPLTYTAQGTYEVAWLYDDGNGNTSTQSQTVIVKDTVPATIVGATASPSSLWPANHKMVGVTIGYAGVDNCDPQPTCRLSVTCNEPITNDDVVILDSHHVQLCAERLGTGSGRVYAITITCTDAAGNSSTKTVPVTVPHDRGH